MATSVGTRLESLATHAASLGTAVDGALGALDEHAVLLSHDAGGAAPWQPLLDASGSKVDELLEATHGVGATPQGAAARSAAAQLLLGERLLRPIGESLEVHGGLNDAARLRLAEALDTYRYAADDLAAAAGSPRTAPRSAYQVTSYETIVDRSSSTAGARQARGAGSEHVDHLDRAPAVPPGFHPGLDAIESKGKRALSVRMYPYGDANGRYLQSSDRIVQHPSRSAAFEAAEATTRGSDRWIGAVAEVGDGTPAPHRFISLRYDGGGGNSMGWERHEADQHIAIAGDQVAEVEGSRIHAMHVVVPLRDGSGVRVAPVTRALGNDDGVTTKPLITD